MYNTDAGNTLNTDYGSFIDDTVSEMVSRFLKQHNICPTPQFFEEYGLKRVDSPNSSETITLKDIERYVEENISDDQKGANGVVFTPQYIIKYILENCNINSDAAKIIDPSCGGGSFLLECATFMSNKFNKSYREIIENNLYGIDIVPKFVECTKLLLALLCLIHNENPINLKFNVICTNSLNTKWEELFKVTGFDHIIGNPPYSNAHDLDDEMAKFIKKTFKTTKKGTSNIFYAFIEKSMDSMTKDGTLGFIIPNNYLSITAAQPLRKLLKESKTISKIVDFNDNMVFRPVRTYNSLLFLNNNKQDLFQYTVLNTTENIEEDLYSATFNNYLTADLEDSGWKLLPNDILQHIHQIESFDEKIKKYIHTGIATLRDDLYIVDGYDESSSCYYKIFNSKKYSIESSIVRNLYKISEIKSEDSIKQAVKKIIFPYTTSYQTNQINQEKTRSNTIIPENVMASKYPHCYEYFCAVKDELAKRDAGRKIEPVWYAYGRTQGLNYIGRKLVFPTFSSKPKFMLLEDEDALFCNGYAFCEEPGISIKLIQNIINSQIMDYYVSSTSYPIEGGYYCYQKKFIQNFSIPPLTEMEKELILTGSKEEIDTLLVHKYHSPLKI